MKRHAQHAPRTSAFSLIEILVVVAIIGVLVGLSFAVGRTVVGGAKRQLTDDILSTLDTAMQAYMDDNGGLPPAFVLIDMPTPTPDQQWPMADMRNMATPSLAGSATPAGYQVINATGLFLLEAQKFPRVKAILEKIPTKQIVRRDPDGVGNGQPELQVILDGWGKPIRLVHPLFDGEIYGNAANATIPIDNLRVDREAIAACPANVLRRNAIATGPVTGAGVLAENFPDSDGGRCQGNRPYFYSAGEDGLVGTISDASGNLVDYNTDNVYRTRPLLPPKP